MTLAYAEPLLAGDAGTAQTIRAIRNLVDDAWKDSVVNRAAIDILRNAGVDQYASDAEKGLALYNWALANMYFVNDPVTKEALRPARELLQMRAGDCDDINAILLPSLLGTVGIEPRLVTIAANSSDPSVFSHIYAEANVDGAWTAYDAARPGAQYGAAPPAWYRREWWSLVDDSHSDYPGYGQLSGQRARRRMSGLGDLTSFFQTAIADSSGLIRSAIGPGGATSITPSVVATPAASASSSILPLLLLGIGGIVLWKMVA